MESRLDDLLEMARERAPTDDLFVGRVMARVRTDVCRRRRVERLITGPVAVAAAAVIALGAGVAALVRSTGTPDSALRTTQAAPATARPAPVDPGDRMPPSFTEGGDAEQTRTYRKGDLEWGYRSDATAFAFDHATGLRLETKLYRTEFDTGVPQRVTLTLRNTGSQAIVVSGLKDCALVVVASPAEGSAAESTDASTRQCATTEGERPSAQPSGPIVLKPGGQRVANATVVLATSGDWSVVGMCECSYGPVGRERGDPKDDPLGDLGRLAEFGVDLPVVSQRSAEPNKRLVTPPIRVTAS